MRQNFNTKLSYTRCYLSVVDFKTKYYMTPKEKAIELVDKYKFYLGNEKENINEAKDLALICVDEIIFLESDIDYWFWQEVILEIEQI